MNRLKILTYTLLAAILLGVIFGICALITRIRYNENGRILIDIVEQYRSMNGHLPYNMHDIEWVEDEGMGPFYERKNDSVFIIYYCLDFDEYYMYISTQQKWCYSYSIDEY